MSTAIRFRFPAGRYHATPWGSHVNEAEVEWPPSPWRILRALIATWHRKVDPEELPESMLESLIKRLAGEPPYYSLPSAAHAHSRHYMPERKGKGERKTLVFDAFARVDPEDGLVVAWPDQSLDQPERDFLGLLVERLGYLGRAESWVEGQLLESWDGVFDCAPIHDGNPDGVGADEDGIRLAAPMTPEAYRVWRSEQIERHDLADRRLNKGEQRLLSTLPPRLIDAMRLDTAPVQKEGWSRHPGLADQLYARPEGALAPRGSGPVRLREPAHKVTTATLILYRQSKPSSPLPRMVDALKVGERFRWSAMRKADDRSLEEGEIPPVLSGHDMPDDNRHRHAFYLPMDSDGDGRIDRIVVHAGAGLDREALGALSAVRRLWLDEGAEWRVLLETYGSTELFAGHPYLAPARVWRSVTPYLHPWYRKKGFMHEHQIRRECRERGLPEPEPERIESLIENGRDMRPVHFHRFRSRRGLRQPDTQGSFWELTFPEPVRGPVALGFGCHHGLGIFRAAEAGED